MNGASYLELAGEGRITRWKKLSEPLLFVDDEEEESRKAEEELKRLGVKYRKIDVRNGLRGWLLFEYGTVKVPILVLEGAVLVGLDEIRRAFSR